LYALISYRGAEAKRENLSSALACCSRGSRVHNEQGRQPPSTHKDLMLRLDFLFSVATGPTCAHTQHRAEDFSRSRNALLSPRCGIDREAVPRLGLLKNCPRSRSSSRSKYFHPRRGIFPHRFSVT
jgi:hypothetical protein